VPAFQLRNLSIVYFIWAGIYFWTIPGGKKSEWRPSTIFDMM